MSSLCLFKLRSVRRKIVKITMVAYKLQKALFKTAIIEINQAY